MSKELGDFQTPLELVAEVLKVLGPTGDHWPRVLEPTCGTGNFIRGLLALPSPPREIKRLELQDAHMRGSEKAARKKGSVLVEIRKANLFEIDLRQELIPMRFHKSNFEKRVRFRPWQISFSTNGKT